MLGTLHMLGAAPVTGLSSQQIIVNVKSIDVDKLRKSIGVEGAKAAGLGAALAIVDNEPKMALDIGIPIGRNYLKDMGVYAEITVANKAPAARGKSEFWPGLAVGVGASTVVFGVGWSAWTLLFKRIFT